MTEEWADIDALLDSVYSAFDPALVMVGIKKDKDGGNVKLHIVQISSGAVIAPNDDTTYDAASLGSFFDDNVGLRWRKTSAAAWTNTEA
jgi:hypothetical protein